VDLDETDNDAVHTMIEGKPRRVPRARPPHLIVDRRRFAGGGSCCG